MSASRFAEELRKRGFEKVDREVSLTVREHTLQNNLSRQQKRRLLRKMRYRPWFTMGIFTYATDELGQTWVGPPDSDLSSLKFDNRTEEMEAMMKKFSSPDIHHH